MKAVIQRVSSARVSVNQKCIDHIGQGLLVFLAIHEDDEKEDQEWLLHKLINLRIFSDIDHKMNLSVHDIKGEVMVISQFTLYGSTKKGNRPSFIHSASPAKAEKMYIDFIESMEQLLAKTIARGQFGGDMQIELINDGPVTIIIDTKNRT